MDLKTLKKKFCIVITGNIGCGKTTVASLIRENRFLVFDADELSKKAVEPGTHTLKKLVKAFGQNILNKNGSLNRAKLRDIIFSSPSKRLLAENIIHPEMQVLLQEQLEKTGLFQSPKIWFYDYPLVYEKHQENEYKEIWLAHCSRETQLGRLLKERKLPQKTAENIILNQIPAENKIKAADFSINTDKSLEDTRKIILQKLSEICFLTERKNAST